MSINLQDWQIEAKAEYTGNIDFLRGLRRDKSIDAKAKALHTEVFAETDCLACANCCRTTPALVTKSDIKRIAKHMSLPPKTFIRKYVLEDLNGELMINNVPCMFLQADNTCEIYEIRPKACREYPHTDQDGFHQRAKLNANNTIVCPATHEIVKRLKAIEDAVG